MPVGVVRPIVALLAEGVGRNLFSASSRSTGRVALLAEGVGRNYAQAVPTDDMDAVALLAEGVGRNWSPITLLAAMLGRPPRGGRG